MKIKKIFASLLAVMLLLAAMPSAAFAAEPSDESPAMTPHTVTIEVPAGEVGEYDVMPLIWDQDDCSLVANYVHDLPGFVIPDPYFAYEVYATAVDGSKINQNYTLSLMFGDGVKAMTSGKANGTVYKNDWISVVPGATYYFRINNATSYSLSVYITYYSW